MALIFISRFPKLLFTNLYRYACDSTHDPVSDIT